MARCPRCRSAVRHSAPPRSTSRAAAFALAALVLYPLAMALPVLEIEEFGHRSSATIWSGVVTLFSDGEILLALIVFLCSIVIPLGKIGGVFVLCAGRRGLARRHRAATYRALDWLGRWGMVDVLLVAVLVALVKLGDIADVHPGPGAAAFAGVVVFSMLASTAFDHLAIWEESSA
ncbi:MAG: paraquat-inducible protein A [Planctomycetota bacterium]|nr:paraquat-inducible protein A [Planctomycetota bacterium]